MDTTFAEALRAAVQRSGKTQAQIAGEAGVDAGQFSRYLRGSEPTASVLRRLCIALPALRRWLKDPVPTKAAS